MFEVTPTTSFHSFPKYKIRVPSTKQETYPKPHSQESVAKLELEPTVPYPQCDSVWLSSCLATRQFYDSSNFNSEGEEMFFSRHEMVFLITLLKCQFEQAHTKVHFSSKEIIISLNYPTNSDRAGLRRGSVKKRVGVGGERGGCGGVSCKPTCGIL